MPKLPGLPPTELLTRAVVALESIAVSLEKLANPPVTVTPTQPYLPNVYPTVYPTIAPPPWTIT